MILRDPTKKEEELAAILEQIRNYPLPLSDGDTKWEDLLRERDRLWFEL